MQWLTVDGFRTTASLLTYSFLTCLVGGVDLQVRQSIPCLNFAHMYARVVEMAHPLHISPTDRVTTFPTPLDV